MAKCYYRPRNLDCIQYTMSKYCCNATVSEKPLWFKDMEKDHRVVSDVEVMYIMTGGNWVKVTLGDWIVYDCDSHDVWVVDELMFYNLYSAQEPEES